MKPAVLLRTLFAGAVLAATAVPAISQEIAESHVKAARQAVSAIRATDLYDGILPSAAAALKRELIQQNPNLQELITKTVDEKALELAGRRGDLEREAALAYARVFSEEYLTEIAAFYNSEAGKKLLSDGPIVARQVEQAAEIWQRGIARDLAQAVGESLFKNAPRPAAPAPEGAAPAEGAAPPAEGAAPPADGAAPAAN